MKHAPIVALALMAALVAGCGGGSSTRITDLEKELAAAQAAQEAAQEEARKAEEAAKAARLARLEAERQADAAQEEARKAEEATEAARLEAKQQADAALAAEQQRQQEQAARQEADSKAAKLEEEAGHTADQLVQANARQVLRGLDTFDSTQDSAQVGTADPTVTPRYRESALVTTAPAVTFSSITTGTSRNWFRTSFSHRGGTNFDRLDVYSDVESPDSVPFRDSTYNTAGTITVKYNPSDTSPSMVVDDNMVVGSVQISATRDDAAASQFPRSGDPLKDFDQTSRGFTSAEFESLDDAAKLEATGLTQAQYDTDLDGLTPEMRWARLSRLHRNVERYPLRYNREVSGTLGGASGTYLCASGTEAVCSVTNQNNHFLFSGPWVFTPSSATSPVRVDDSEFMYFGWWARQANSTGDWTFRTFHGPSESGDGGNRSTVNEIDDLSGTATYRGPAVGQFSFYQPLTAQSDYGEFSAMATLRADFDDDMVDGTIDQFDQHPDWTLTLKHAPISAGGDATIASGTNGVSWQIDGEAVAAPDSGTWEAAFYSDLPADERDGTVPTGMAGTFEAAYHNVGRIIGAFGARKQP